MARALDGLPDLWALFRQLRYWKNLFRKNKPPATPNSSQEKAVTVADNITPVSKQQGWTVHQQAQQKYSPQAEPQAKRHDKLHSHLRDRQFLQQAFVVNEILNKPLALRRSRRHK